MIRRRFLDLTRRALSGAIFATLLGVKPSWRFDGMTWEQDPKPQPLIMWHLTGPGIDQRGEGSPPVFEHLNANTLYTMRVTYL